MVGRGPSYSTEIESNGLRLDGILGVTVTGPNLKYAPPVFKFYAARRLSRDSDVMAKPEARQSLDSENRLGVCRPVIA